MKTFYLAGSSAEREDLELLAAELEALGFEWACGWNWMEDFGRAEQDKSRWAKRATLDLASATHADLFVVVACPKLAFGAGAEFGARYAIGKKTELVLYGGRQIDHPFFLLPNVRIWATWKRLTDHLSPSGRVHPD